MTAGFTFQIPGGNMLPANHVTVNITADFVTPLRSNVYFDDAPTITFDLKGGPLAGSTYIVRDYYGDVIDSGAASDPLTIVNPGPGWYKLYIVSVVPAAAPWGTCQGSAAFSVWRNTPALAPKLALSDPRSANYLDSDTSLRAHALAGPPREAVRSNSNPAADIATISTDVALLNHRYMAYDTARPKGLMVAFPYWWNTDPGSVVSDTVAALGADVRYYEGRNEPDGLGAAAWLPKQATFYSQVKTADPTAKVMGPCPTSLAGTTIGFLDEFFAGGGADSIDVLSVHDYNGINGDLALGRKVWDRFMAVIYKHGVEGLERWMTEWGNHAHHYGVFQPRHQARWIMTAFLLWDQYGIPKERTSYFYDVSHGFWDFPSWWMQSPTRNTTPALTMMRVFSEELLGKTFDSRLGFGTTEDRWTLGNRYTAEDGSQVIAMMSAGRTDDVRTLGVRGAASLTVVSALGVESTVAVSAGRASVPLENGVPTYVRIPVGVTAWPVAGRFGLDLARGKAVAGTGARAAQVTDGVQESWYYLQHGDPLDDPTAPYIAAASLPDATEVDLGAPTTFDTIVVECAPPWQGQGTLLDFDIDCWTGSAWATLGTFTEPTNTIPWAADQYDGACQVDSFFSDRSVFVLTFSPVTATKVRINVRDCTLGGSPDQTCKDAGGQGMTAKQVTLRGIHVYHLASLPAPKYTGRISP